MPWLSRGRTTVFGRQCLAWASSSLLLRKLSRVFFEMPFSRALQPVVWFARACCDKVWGSMGRTLSLLVLGVSLCLTALAAANPRFLDAGADFPLPLDSYHDQQTPSLLGKLAGRRSSTKRFSEIQRADRGWCWPRIPVSAPQPGISHSQPARRSPRVIAAGWRSR